MSTTSKINLAGVQFDIADKEARQGLLDLAASIPSVDSALDSTSNNPIANSAVATALNEKTTLAEVHGNLQSWLSVTDKSDFLKGVSNYSHRNNGNKNVHYGKFGAAIVSDNNETIPANSLFRFTSMTTDSPMNYPFVGTLLNSSYEPVGTLVVRADSTADNNGQLLYFPSSSASGSVAVDTELDSSSSNAVANSAVTTALNSKQDTLTAGDGIDISTDTVSLDAETLTAIDEYKTRKKVLALSASASYMVTPADTGTPSSSTPVTYVNSSTGVLFNMQDHAITVKLNKGKITVTLAAERHGIPTVGANGGSLTYRLHWSSVLSALRSSLSSDDEKALFDTHIATMLLTGNIPTQTLSGAAAFHGEPGAECIAVSYVSIGGNTSGKAITQLNITYNFGYVLQVISDGEFSGSTEDYTVTALDWTLNH